MTCTGSSGCWGIKAEYVASLMANCGPPEPGLPAPHNLGPVYPVGLIEVVCRCELPWAARRRTASSIPRASASTSGALS